MNTITRQPKLLVKIASAPAAARLSFAGETIDVLFEPLFHSIGPVGLRAAAEPTWHIMAAPQSGPEVNAWDLAHAMVRQELGLANAPVPEFAEPDLTQQWLFGTEAQHALSLTRTCEKGAAPDARLPNGTGPFWFRDDLHSQLERARNDVPEAPNRVRIAHLDTGYDPAHITKPRFLRTDLQRNFVDPEFPNDATDRTSGFFVNLGHGTGTIGILAGAAVDGSPLGGAPSTDVIPVRVANSVVLFENSAIARAFDYVHGLASNPDTRVHVITMSMGGLASQAWAEAVNALYDAGVFIVTAAGNNFGNLPTHNIVYPARFKRVVAACGIMANGSPYADLGLTIMAGNYGPDSKMDTAIAAFTPNTPWAKIGCETIVDHNGSGTSSSTPQVAAAAALWIQQHKAEWEGYAEDWMRVEAVRKALFDSAKLPKPDLKRKIGRGALHAEDALAQTAASASELHKQPTDTAQFPLFRVLTGLGITAAPDARQRMLELEALQLMQRSHELEAILPDPEVDPGQVSPTDKQRFLEALIATPGTSNTLRKAAGRQLSNGRTQAAVPVNVPPADRERLKRAMDPAVASPPSRSLRVFAFDPLLQTRLETMVLNETTLDIIWEKNLEPGPVGEYLEVVDVDPSTGCCYAPVDLNHPAILAQGGLPPSEGNPHFHQQMVYAVAMKTIEHFERALGRTALWAPRLIEHSGKYEEHPVQRLRIYPHALREANAFYSPDRKALLFGYFSASASNPGDNLPGGVIFGCLSHDIVAHETTHALLDGLHRRYREATNPDMLAFHEAFADIVALFQHFTVTEALRDQIAKTQGNLGAQNLLGELALQFGQATGRYGALRSAIGHYENGVWTPTLPKPTDYANATEPHDRGAILVAAIFASFLDIYRNRSRDLIRLATGGTGILPPGDIPQDLVNRLSDEAAKTAGHVLTMCIRALDYCPPVDLTFGDYVRALITADRDIVPDDRHGYRVAFVQAFRSRGIYPQFVRNLSPEALVWEPPNIDVDIPKALEDISLAWDLHCDRRGAFYTSKANAAKLNGWLNNPKNVADDKLEAFGFHRDVDKPVTVDGITGRLSRFEVHSVRPVRRVGPDGQQRMELLVEITQSWTPDGKPDVKYRGGATVLIDLETRLIRYSIRKRVANVDRIAAQDAFRLEFAASSLSSSYFDTAARMAEPFAMLHRGV